MMFNFNILASRQVLGWVFWLSLAFIAYTYFGYPGWLWLRRKWHPRPVTMAPVLPSISIIIILRNEGAVLDRKLRNLLSLDYPPELREIVLVSDGSTDGTNRMLSDFAAQIPGVKILLNQAQRGKAAGLTDGISAATGEIVVFMDARQEIANNAVRVLMENFADPEVGCASGQLMIGDPFSGETFRRMGFYWKIEKLIRELESASGSVVGATGALYAARRNLVVSPPPETILDDVYIPMHVIRQQARVVFDFRALAWDPPDRSTGREFAQKVRTLSGNYQLLKLAPWLLRRTNPLRFEFVSHKLMRLVIPFALSAALVSSFLLSHPIYRVALIAQLAFYGLSAIALTRPRLNFVRRAADAAFTFVLLNTAAVVAFANFVTGRKVTWVR